MTDYNQLKVVDLKDVLKDRGIPSTGLTRKQHIIEALEADDAKKDQADGKSEAVEETEAANDEQNGGDGADGAERAGDVVEKLQDSVAGEKIDEKGTSGDVTEVIQDKDHTPEASASTKNPLSEPLVSDTAIKQPIVLENDEPVSQEPSQLANPQQTSPIPADVSSETRKRKRRSPTPSVSVETVNKKLRSAEEEQVKLPEDTVVEDAPVPMDHVAGDEMESESRVMPYGSSDDFMDVKEQSKGEDVTMSEPMLPSEGVDKGLEANTSVPTAPHSLGDDYADIKDPSETTSVPAIHPATRALYVRNLIRPLQPAELRSYIESRATPPTGDALDEPFVEMFHLDVLRTHAFALCRTVSHASRARSRMHDKIFPDEPARKPLFVDFVPEEKLQDWIDTELSSGASRRDAKRWEVAYDTTPDGEVTATLQEVHASQGAGMRQPSFSSETPGQGMPNAPLGPRGYPSQSQDPLPSSRSPTATTKPAPTPASTDPSFTNLDSHFQFTTTKPKLYFLPKSAELVDKRLDELEALTSRDWDDGRGAPIGGVDGQLRRYTFEDGDRLVDGGPDKGDFGLPQVARRGGRGRYGGGGSGRWRGR